MKKTKENVIIHFKQAMAELGEAQVTQQCSSVILELDLSFEVGGSAIGKKEYLLQCKVQLILLQIQMRVLQD